jgi:hypothetical protein
VIAFGLWVKAVGERMADEGVELVATPQPRQVFVYQSGCE